MGIPGTLLPKVGQNQLAMKKELKHPKYGLESHRKRFGTEEQCRQYLAELRWENGVPTCPHKDCGNSHMNYYVSTRKKWKCSVCHRQFSLLSKSIFSNTNLELTKWFEAIYYFTVHKRGISSCQLARNLEIEQRTAWFVLHRLREALNNDNSLNLSGEIEVDETFIGPRIGRDTRLQRQKKVHDAEQERIHGLSKWKKRRQRGKPAKRGRKKGSTKEVLEQKKLEKQLRGERIPFEQPVAVLGILQRDGKIHLQALGRSEKAVTKNNIFPILKKHISSKSIIVSDQYNLYDATAEIFKGHQSVNHEEGFVIKGVHINGIENVFKHTKKMIEGTYFHMQLQHFNSYLLEHCYRWNAINRTDKEKVDEYFPEVIGKQLRYEDLISRSFNLLISAA